MKKRTLAALLSLAMIVGMLSFSAFAQGTETEDPYEGYTVVPLAATDDLAVKITSAVHKTKFVLADGEYTMPAEFNSQDNPRDIAFTGSRNAVININGASYPHDLTFIFDGVTVKFPNTGDYYGFSHIVNLKYNNCKIYGQQFLYSVETEFINCEFENSADAYCVWTYIASQPKENAPGCSEDNTITFTKCVFNTAGKAIFVYNEAQNASYKSSVTLNDCVFNSNNSDPGKAAVETGSNGGNTPTSNRYYITFINCTANGFIANNGTNTTTNLSTSPLWGNKNGMDREHLIVIIDGIEVTQEHIHDDGTVFKPYIDTLAGNVFLYDDAVLTSDLTVTGDVHICLNGHKLNLNGHTLTVAGSITICDCQTSLTHGSALDGLWIPYGYGADLIGGVIHGGRVEVTGSLVLKSGNLAGLTGGVKLTDGGALTVEGGKLGYNVK